MCVFRRMMMMIATTYLFQNLENVVCTSKFINDIMNSHIVWKEWSYAWKEYSTCKLTRKLPLVHNRPTVCVHQFCAGMFAQETAKCNTHIATKLIIMVKIMPPHKRRWVSKGFSSDKLSSKLNFACAEHNKQFSKRKNYWRSAMRQSLKKNEISIWYVHANTAMLISLTMGSTFCRRLLVLVFGFS